MPQGDHHAPPPSPGHFRSSEDPAHTSGLPRVSPITTEESCPLTGPPHLTRHIHCTGARSVHSGNLRAQGLRARWRPWRLHSCKQLKSTPLCKVDPGCDKIHAHFVGKEAFIHLNTWPLLLPGGRVCASSQGSRSFRQGLTEKAAHSRANRRWLGRRSPKGAGLPAPPQCAFLLPRPRLGASARPECSRVTQSTLDCARPVEWPRTSAEPPRAVAVLPCHATAQALPSATAETKAVGKR